MSAKRFTCVLTRPYFVYAIHDAANQTVNSESALQVSGDRKRAKRQVRGQNVGQLSIEQSKIIGRSEWFRRSIGRGFACCRRSAKKASAAFGRERGWSCSDCIRGRKPTRRALPARDHGCSCANAIFCAEICSLGERLLNRRSTRLDCCEHLGRFPRRQLLGRETVSIRHVVPPSPLAPQWRLPVP